MSRLICLVLPALAALALVPAAPAGSRGKSSPSPLAVLDKDIAPVLDKHKVPALGVAVINSKGLIGLGMIGVRKKGETVKVTTQDKFHLGSDTKQLTGSPDRRTDPAGQAPPRPDAGEVVPRDRPRPCTPT